MTWTWVSVGSGNASTVRSRNASQPQITTTAVRASTAALFFSEKSTMCSNTGSLLQGELVEEQDRALAHEPAPRIQPAPELHLPGALPAGCHGDPLQLPLAPRDEHHRALAVGHHRLGRDPDALLRGVGLQLDVDEGVGAEGAVLVRRADADLHRPSLWIHHLRDAVDGAGASQVPGPGVDDHRCAHPE